MPDIKVIANPLAGRGRGLRTIPRASELLARAGVKFSLAQTQYSGHAVELARDAVRAGFNTVVALGGDGTVHEVVNGMCADMGSDPNPGEVVKLGVIPAGSGNDFAYAVGLPPDFRTAVSRLIDGHTRLVDMGRINGRFFAYGVGIGFDAEVNIESRKIKRLRGMLLYLIALLRVMILHHRSYQVEINYDDGHLEQQAMMVSVANGRRYAGAFLVTPDARIDDGLLNLCVISPVNRLQMVRLLPLVLKGAHTHLKEVKMYSAREVVVKSRMPLVSHVDGEIFGLDERRYEFSLLPQRLRVIC